MRYYCTLDVRSHEEDMDAIVFRAEALDLLVFEDTRSAASLARAERWRTPQMADRFVVRNDLPRYVWSLTSLKAIHADEPDAHVHIAWLLSQLKSSDALTLAGKAGAECLLSFYWGGGGTGGGPTVTPALAALLCQHGVAMDIGFYLEGV